MVFLVVISTLFTFHGVKIKTNLSPSGTFFIIFFVPETRGKSQEELKAYFRGKKYEADNVSIESMESISSVESSSSEESNDGKGK